MATAVSVGLISDTHNYLNPEVLAVFGEHNVVAIIHAGDISRADILYSLEMVAPVTAVLGNNDLDIPGWSLNPTATCTVHGMRIGVVHQRAAYGPIPPDIDVLVCGHTHRPEVQLDRTSQTLVVNPGSASYPRNPDGPTVAILEIIGQPSGTKMVYDSVRLIRSAIEKVSATNLM